MNNKRKAQVLSLLATLFIITLLIYEAQVPVQTPIQDSFQATVTYTVNATISFYSNGHLVRSYTGLDPLTNLGLNLTFAKLTGFTPYNLTTYNMNATYVCLANYSTVTPSATSTTLQGEFIRMNGSGHAVVYNGYNLTATFTGFSGTNSTNCMGVVYSSGLGNSDIFGYITYSLVTGIDSTFTVVCEIQIQGTTS